MCGISAIVNYKPNKKIINEILVNINILSNRGRDSYGLLLSNTNSNTNNTYLNNDYILKQITIPTYKDIIDNNIDIDCNIAIGHTRYSTNYLKNTKGNLKYAQPICGTHPLLGKFYLVHNGNINFNNYYKKKFPNFIDSQILVKIIEKGEKEETWISIIQWIYQTIPGTYNIIIKCGSNIYAFKDRYNVRPLCIGKNSSGICISSESSALSAYEYVREISSKEIIVINTNMCGFNSIKQKNTDVDNLNICLFEHIYFLRPKSNIDSMTTFQIRYLFGENMAINEESKYLSKERKKEIVVVGSPNSGIASAQGFANKLQVEYYQLLEKNKNSARSFILKNNEERRQECSKKFVLNEELLNDDKKRNMMKNKIIYLLDDSIVRGNTMDFMINLLRLLEPKEIHIRIPSPKIINICKFGIDIPTKEELLMNRINEDEFAKLYNIDSLKFIATDTITQILAQSINVKTNDICTGCFGGSFKKELLDW